jgi:hypothetical protein
VWNVARSPDEIAAAMYETIAAGAGLVGRWALDEADAGAPDSLGANDGTVAGEAAFDSNAVVLDQGLPPVVAATAPADDALLPSDEAELGLTVTDDTSTELTATFYVREVSDADDFTVVVLPDTQYYSDDDTNNGGSDAYFTAQTQWIRDNREAYNILAVIHNGDIVNHGSDDAEWIVADGAMSILETPEGPLVHGVPYGVSVGNHDQDALGSDGATVGFNAWFGVDRFAGRTYYGGHYDVDNDENWFTFSAGALQFVVVSLQYDTTPDPAVLSWARSVFEAHPDAFGVLNTHFILGASAAFSTQGQAVYDALQDLDNVQLMTCGHITAESRRTDVFGDNVIHSMLADYQGDGDGGSGFLRIWEFSPANDELTVRSYSPVSDQWLTGEDSEFTLEVDLPGAGEMFTDVATVEGPPDALTLVAPGLEAGRIYEWYATVSDCVHTVRTPVRRFTTQP